MELPMPRKRSTSARNPGLEHALTWKSHSGGDQAMARATVAMSAFRHAQPKQEAAASAQSRTRFLFYALRPATAFLILRGSLESCHNAISRAKFSQHSSVREN